MHRQRRLVLLGINFSRTRVLRNSMSASVFIISEVCKYFSKTLSKLIIPLLKHYTIECHTFRQRQICIPSFNGLQHIVTCPLDPLASEDRTMECLPLVVTAPNLQTGESYGLRNSHLGQQEICRTGVGEVRDCVRRRAKARRGRWG